MRLVLFVAALTAQAAVAICPAPQLKVCSVFFESDKVFYGKVIKVTPIGFEDREPGEDDLISRHRYTIAVEQRFKGKIGTVENVETDNDSGRWYSEVGERRVLFVRNGMVSGLCSPIDEGKHARETIRQIRALRAATGATIEGEVRRGSSYDPLPHRKVVVFGANGRHEATTDREGAFLIRVKPGRYRLEPDLHPWDYNASTLNVHDFTLARGQCAQFQVHPIDPRKAIPGAATR
jgi:hypothetical protein